MKKTEDCFLKVKSDYLKFLSKERIFTNSTTDKISNLKKIYMKKVGKIQKKIGLIKVDTNGNELFVIKALQKIIKKNKPAIIVEINNDILSIDKILKKHSYKGYYYSVEKKKFVELEKKSTLNKYYLQKKHLYKQF